jgi:seryl-tRNA synthetase
LRQEVEDLESDIEGLESDIAEIMEKLPDTVMDDVVRNKRLREQFVKRYKTPSPVSVRDWWQPAVSA